jgi:hypothetical protein
MTRFVTITLLALLPAAVPAALAAQRTPREVNVDIGVVSASVGVAIQSSPGRLYGVQVGVGGDWINRTLLGGSHFKDNGGDQMFELGHVAVFHRGHYGRRFSMDVGLRLAPFIHGTDLDDDAALAGFAGAYVQPMVGIGGRFAVGPRVLVGALSEGGDRTEFGVNVAPIVGRVTFGR